MYLSGNMGSFFTTITIDQGFGAEFGVTAACFNRWSPLSKDGEDSLNRDKKLIKLLQVCDFNIVGLTMADLFTTTITASCTNLKKIGKGYAYKVVQLDKDGIADFDILKNVVPTITGVSFDFVTIYSRICLIKVKMDKNYSPVGWAGLHDNFEPPKNNFKYSLKVKEEDITTNTITFFNHSQFGSNSIASYNQLGGCKQLNYSTYFVLFMLLVMLFWNLC